jgi:hypothetical protein
MTPAPSFFSESFAGAWTVRRKMIDHRNKSVYFFDGTASITASTFDERGEMVSGDHRFSSGRSYRLQPDGESLSVLFPSGSGFVALQWQGAQQVFHLCGSDHYTGRFFFRSPDDWAEAWRVHGPQKRYSSLSRYRRIAASS